MQIEYEGLIYPSVENAFQAVKKAPHRRLPFTRIPPKEARKLERKPPIRDDWNMVKVKIMRELVYKKFKNNEDLKRKLLETGDAILIEGNTWNDTFWGVSLKKPDPNSEWRYVGKNMLGIILMEVRELLRKEEA